MLCRIVQQKLDLYANQGLPRPEQDQVESHLRSCPVCQQALARQVRLRTLLQVVAVPPVPEDFGERVLAAAVQRETVVTELPASRRADGVGVGRIRSAWGMAAALAAGLLIGVLLGHGTWRPDASGSGDQAQANSGAVSRWDPWIDPGDDELAQTYLRLTSPRDG
ncbi:MAG: zf-HC2 domain-containing protein [Candidatus Anammoximicrobium sp.]|nr:zf-HC2 domain-containing protein [Candidatus Anammoximicrobium sp.]